MALAEPLLLMATGIVLFADRVGRLALEPGAFQWVASLREWNSGPGAGVPARSTAANSRGGAHHLEAVYFG